MWLSTKRVFKSGLQSFVRNGFVSVSSVLVMTITLFIITSFIILAGCLNYSLEQVKNKVDVNVYFVTTASEPEVLMVKKSLEALPEVASIEYISRDQALENFKAKHQGDQLILQSIDQLGDNPLGATLNIRAKDPSQYAGIAKYLDSISTGAASDNASNIIYKFNYAQNKVIIDRLTNIINSANRVGMWFAIIFIFISIVVTFNTIKMTIFMARDEISVMRLVGASNMYVKGPFIVNGLLYGVISSLIILISVAVATFSINHYYGSYFIGFDLFKYYIDNFLRIFGIVLGSGIGLGVVSSYLATMKYLKE